MNCRTDHVVFFFIHLHPGEDDYVSSSDVFRVDGEAWIPIPVFLVDDEIPELEENFRIVLLNETTGGAMLGNFTETTVTMLLMTPMEDLVSEDMSVLHLAIITVLYLLWDAVHSINHHVFNVRYFSHHAALSWLV